MPHPHAADRPPNPAPGSGAPTRARRPLRLRTKIAALAASLIVSLVAAEAVIRMASGYYVWTIGLHRKPLGAAVQRAPFAARIDRFLAASPPGLDRAWFDASPPPLERGPVDPEHARMVELWLGLPPFYVYNGPLIDALRTNREVLHNYFGPTLPDSLLVFDVGAEQDHPRFRYPANATLPSGLVTNRFGFRGPQLELAKRPRTMRIGCVGASTTVNQHGIPWSYPELVGHWLGLWAKARGLDLDFEVINAGREAQVSTDLLAIARQELLPLAVDYVVYYEGANQFDPFTLFRTATGEQVRRGEKPPDGLVPGWPGVDAEATTLVDELATWSAIVERLRSVVDRGRRFAEPPKPDVTFALPPGVDERDPPLDHLQGVMLLPDIVRDLDAMHAALRGADARLVMCTFAWCLDDGMELDAQTQRAMFATINRAIWPLRYRDAARAGALQNRVFAKWAATHGVDLVDVAARMPHDPDLFTDQVHNTDLGVRIRAWCVFEGLVAVLARDLAAGVVPNGRTAATTHPALLPPRRVPLGG